MRNSGLFHCSFLLATTSTNACVNRNVIERIFGAVKKKYKILNTPLEYDMATQRDIIYCVAFLHNFQQRYGDDDEDADEQMTSDEERTRESDQRQEEIHSSVQDDREVAKMRDKMAKKMWKQYQRTLQARNPI